MPYRLIDPNRSPHLRTALHIIGGTATAVLVIGVIFLLTTTYTLTSLVRETQVTNTQRAEDTKKAAENASTAADNAARSADRIEDCTTPGFQCFEDNQKRLATTVGSINDYALAAAACADQPETQTVQQIRLCILSVIDRPERR